MKNALLLLSVFLIAGSTATFAQSPAGPEANPNKRLDCSSAGHIRNDSGSCTPIEIYLSNGSNRVFWVDQRAGNDSNAGTKDRPWKTIQRANKRGQLAAGDAVIIRGGVYRETIRPTVSGKSGARLTYAAYPGDDVVVSGAVPADDGWTLHGGNIYKRPFNLSLNIDCPWDDCSSVSWRRELLVVDGNLMTQVNLLSSIDSPGEFFVDGFPPSTAPRWIYARFPKDQSPGSLRIEIGKESTLFLPEGTTERTCRGDKGFYRLIGLTFRHATNYRQAGAVCSGEQGSLFEEITMESTNALGINLSGGGHILRGNTAINNGQAGIQGGCDNCLLEYNESSANNWRRHPRGYSGGGGKFSNTNNTVIRYHLAKDNIGRGLWFDHSNYNNIVENSFFINNEIAGLHLEYKSNYNIVRNNVFHGTRWQGWTGSGVLTHAANNNTIVHNTFIANEGTGLWIRYNNREPDGYNKIFNNLFVNNATTGNVNKAFEISLVTETNQLDGNIYWSHKGLAAPTFQYAATNWKGDDLAKWRSLTGGEKGAKIIERSATLIQNLSSAEGWRLVANSAAIGNAVPLPAAIDAIRKDIEDDPRSASGADVGADEYAGQVELPPVNTTIGESGAVSIRQGSAGEWHRLTFKKSYANPAVVMSKLSQNGNQPFTIRVRNVTSGGCEFQLDEWDYLDGRHAEETFGYVVVEAGKHTLEDGRVVYAGHTVAGKDKRTVAFPQSFSKRPVVFSQIVTDHETWAGVTRLTDVSTSGFGIFLQPQQSVKTYGDEKVAWIAISAGSGSTAGKRYEAGTTGNVVSDSWYKLSFTQNFAASPVVLTSMQTANGRDVAGLRLRSLTSAGADVSVEEGQSADKETRHTDEVVGYLSVEAGLIEVGSHSLASSSAAESAEAIDQMAQSSAADLNLPDRFALHENYPNPFNPRTTIRFDLPKESHVQLEVFDVVGRRVALLADGPHNAGTHEVHFEAENLPSGMYLYRLKAGTFLQTGRMLLVK